MLRATGVGRGCGASFTITLDHDHRHRRRLRLATNEGLDFLLDLPEARVLHDGDLLHLEDGRTVAVRAAAEDVLEVRAADAQALARLAWHLGNRHTPVQVMADRLRLRPDHVLEAMLVQHGATLVHVRAPFDPETGAYAGGHGHDHADDR